MNGRLKKIILFAMFCVIGCLYGNTAGAAGPTEIVFPLPKSDVYYMTTYEGHGASNATFRCAVDITKYCEIGIEGYDVYAVASGTVVETDMSNGQITVMVPTPLTTINGYTYGSWYYTYAHMKNVSVARYSQVTAGQKVGETSAVGKASGPHLHLSFSSADNGATHWDHYNTDLAISPYYIYGMVDQAGNDLPYMIHDKEGNAVTEWLINHVPGGDSAQSATVYFDECRVQATDVDNIQTSAWINNTEGKTLSQIGVQIGTDTNHLTESVITTNVGWTRAQLNYSMKDYFGALASNCPYYIRYFTSVGEQRYYSGWITATTDKDVISFDTYSTEDVTDRDAVFSAWLDNPNARTLSQIVVQAGESKDNYQSVIVAENVSWTRPCIKKNLASILGKDLDAATEYFARCYAVSDGKYYYGDWFVVKTANGDVTFDTDRMIYVEDITAKRAVWMDNPKAFAVTIGIECGINKTNAKSAVICSNVVWTRADLNYDIRTYLGDLQPGIHYYTRYYVVAGDRRYNSSWAEFTTSPMEITFGSIQVTKNSSARYIAASEINNNNGHSISLGIEFSEKKDGTTSRIAQENMSDTYREITSDLTSMLGSVKANTPYQIRYYAVYNSKYYYSDWADCSIELIPDFRLPNHLKTIEDQAFSGVKNVVVFVPNTVSSISSGAFDPSATILCKSGSNAERICRELGLTVITEN